MVHTTFLKKHAITQKFKMADFDILQLQSLERHNILHSLSPILYSNSK